MAIGAMDLLKYGVLQPFMQGGQQQAQQPQQNMTAGQNRLGGSAGMANAGMEAAGLNTKGPESSFWWGAPGQAQFYPSMNKQQQGLQGVSIDKILELLGGGLGIGQQDYSAFEPFEQRARSQFATKTVPMLAERFTNMGSQSRSGSYMPALSSAAGDLESQLHTARSEYGLGQQKMQHNLLGNLLGLAQKSPWESIYHQRQPGFAEEGGKEAISTLMKLLGAAFL